MAVITPWTPGSFDWAPVVAAWRSGQLVGFPTDAGYVLTGSALDPQAMDRLRSSTGGPLALTLIYPSEAFDWLPYLRGVGVRLARAFWPGALVLLSSAGVHEGLAARLPAESRRALLHEGKLGLACPNHVAVRQGAYQAQIPIALAWPTSGAPSAGELASLMSDEALIVDGGEVSASGPTVVAVDRQATVIREGAVTASGIEEVLPCRIVFLCTGNTCRSPMAQALCQLLLAECQGCGPADLKARGFIVQSAGLAALAGEVASPEGTEVVRGYGGDLSEHRSRPITYELLTQADFVFTMTRSHLRLLRDLQLDVGPQPRLLSLSGEDVPDPIGGPPETYHQCAAQIRACLERLLPELLESGYSQPG